MSAGGCRNHPPVKGLWHGLQAGADNLLLPGERRFDRLPKTHSAVVLGSKSSADFQKRPRSRESGQTFRPSTQARAGARLIQQRYSAASGGHKAGCRGKQPRASPSARLRPTIAPGIACRNPSGKPSMHAGAAVCWLSCAQPPLAGRKRLSGRRSSGNPAKYGRKSIHFGSFRGSAFRLPKHRHEASRLFQQPAVGEKSQNSATPGETRKPAGLVAAHPVSVSLKT